MLSKRMPIHGILMGSISGAAPMLGGDVGAADAINAGAAITFLMLFFWQHPALYSIAVYRQAEYARAGVPVISDVRGIPSTIRQILAYTIAFVAVSLLPQPFDHAGWSYTGVVALLGAGWLVMAARGPRASNPENWARLTFRYALIMMFAISLMLAAGPPTALALPVPAPAPGIPCPGTHFLGHSQPCRQP